MRDQHVVDGDSTGPRAAFGTPLDQPLFVTIEMAVVIAESRAFERRLEAGALQCCEPFPPLAREARGSEHDAAKMHRPA